MGDDPLTVLFDLDGTLTDSHRGITNCIRYALEGLNIQIPDDLSWCVGPPLHQSFAKILDTEDPERLKDAITKFRERFVPIGMFENNVYCGITDMLGELLKQGFAVHVATSKPEIYAKQILNHFELDLFFKSIHGSELDGTRTAKVELLQHVIEVLSLNPARTVMVGDREHDLLGAKAHGIKTIAVTWGYGTLDELKPHAPDFICHSPAAVLKSIFKCI